MADNTSSDAEQQKTKLQKKADRILDEWAEKIIYHVHCKKALTVRDLVHWANHKVEREGLARPQWSEREWKQAIRRAAMRRVHPSK